MAKKWILDGEEWFEYESGIGERRAKGLAKILNMRAIKKTQSYSPFGKWSIIWRKGE